MHSILYYHTAEKHTRTTTAVCTAVVVNCLMNTLPYRAIFAGLREGVLSNYFLLILLILLSLSTFSLKGNSVGDHGDKLGICGLAFDI